MSYTGKCYWLPQGSLSVAANTPTVLPQSNWLAIGNSDQSVADANNAYIMNSQGILTIPTSSKFDISCLIDQTDFGFSGNLTVTFTYVPVNSASQSPKYTLGTIVTTPTQKQGVLEQRFKANAGDYISIAFNFASALNCPAVNTPANTVLIFTDLILTGDSTEEFYYGTSGNPVFYAYMNKISVMQTAKVINGVATISLTQDGSSTGCAIFNTIVAVNVTAQAPSNINSPLGVACITLNPFPTNLKTISMEVAVNGALPPANYTVIAEVKGC